MNKQRRSPAPEADAAAAPAGPAQIGAQETLGNAFVQQLANQDSVAQASGELFDTGQEVWVRRSVLGLTYHHAGVHIGAGKVMEVTGEPLETMRNVLMGEPVASVKRSTLAEFADGGSVIEGPTPTSREPIEAAVIASSKEGMGWDYDPVNHNCQHFSSEMVSGIARSPEGDTIKEAMEQVYKSGAESGEASRSGLEKAGKWLMDLGSDVGEELSSWFEPS